MSGLPNRPFSRGFSSRRFWIAPRSAAVSAASVPMTFSHPCGCAAHEQGEHRFLLEGLRPPNPSHRVGGWGNQVSPSPCVRARPSRGRGRGGTGLPHPPALAAYVHVSNWITIWRVDRSAMLSGLRSGICIYPVVYQTLAPPSPTA